MHGKRFGVGLLGGLLLGLVVVASAGFTNLGSFATLSPASGSYEVGRAVTTATTTSASSSTNASAGSVAVPPVASTSSSTSTAATNSSQGSTLNFAQAGIGQKNSNLDNIPSQPLLVNGIVFLPVLVAFLLGAILYRTSKRGVPEQN